MKLCVLANLYGELSLEEVLKKLKPMGVQAVEIGSGGFPGKAHCNPKELLDDDKKLRAWKELFTNCEIEIAALSCHGNPVHPKEDEAKRFDKDFKDTVLLAEKIGVDTVITFSGCPGGSKEDKMPNWVTCPWPDDFLKILSYQWNDVLIPYWKNAARFAEDHGVTKIALEMHPGFCVYNPETLMRLRKEVGNVIGANFDPSHLVWQGIDPVAAIRYLGDAIYHFHAKDTNIDSINVKQNGVLDTKHYSDEINRSWVFRTVGYGHGMQWWRDVVSNLRMAGYDKVMSIEHEDSLTSTDEGLSKAVEFLKQAMLLDNKPDTMSWA